MPHKDGFVPELSIVIPTVNQATLTVRCFASIRKWTKTPYEIVWVDNGSRQEEHNIILKQARCPRVHTKLVRFKHNTGFVRGTNAGIKEAEGKYVVLLNNDTEVTVNWDKKLIYPLAKDPKVGCVGPITQSKIAWQEACSLNARWQLGLPTYRANPGEYARDLDRNFGKRYIDTKKLPLSFFCAAFRRETFDRYGVLCEDFGYGLGDDDEYCHRLRSAGLQLVLSLGTFVMHHHRTTFSALGLNVDGIRRHNIGVLRDKTRKKPGG